MHRFLALACSWSCLAAQAPSPWATLAVPAGVNPPAVLSIGKLIAYPQGGTLHAWSAFTRAWTATAASAAATVRVTNDCLLVQDGATWKGFAAHLGIFQPLAVTPQAQLLNPAGRDNDSILLVLDGVQLHAFSGFVGTWTSRTVSPTAAWSVQRHTAVLAQGNLLSGFDAFTGRWHDLVVGTSPTSLSTDGVAGLAIGPTEVHAFSAVHGTWQSAPLPAAANFARNDDWALFYDATQMLAYSGTQGRFEHAPLGAAAVTQSEDSFGIVDTSLGLVAFSAIRGSFSPPLAPATARVRCNVAVALLVDGLQVHAYSAVRNSVATIALDSFFEEAASSVAYAIENVTGRPFVFSALTGSWHQTPQGVLATGPVATTTSILLATTTGLCAFSARTGAFVPLVGGGLTAVGNPSSAIAAAFDAQHLHAFDARADRWLATPRTGQGSPFVQIWRTNLYAIDGQTAHGFGAQSGQWSALVLPEPFVAGRANSESSRLVTQNFVLACSALPELTSLAQFPEFRRVLPTGATLHLHVPMQPGDLGILGTGFLAAQPTPVPGLGGTLRLEPASLVSSLLLPAPGEPRARTALPIPAGPWLAGVELGFQALLLRSGASPYLTEATTVRID